MITSEKINFWLEVANVTNTLTTFEVSGDPVKQMKYFLVDMKAQVDRWDLVTEAFIFNENQKSIVGELIPDKEINQLGEWKIWGAHLLFSKEIPGDKVLAISFHGESQVYQTESYKYRYVAAGELPSEKLVRYLNMKVFW